MYLKYQTEKEKVEYNQATIAARGALLPEFDEEGFIKNPRFFDRDPKN